ncbi:CD48 antigen-like isoform X2 [Alosa pseudoharengus]|uniref:CD48 antigen-like isoform X2 n=1 Tax=Alosa pseudoharengus TaxID=34774 RepID=UPI003F88DE29
MQITVFFFFLFVVQVSPGVTSAVQHTVRRKEGDTVTLQTQDTGNKDRITWLFEGKMIVESPATKGDVYKNDTDPFKGRLQLDNQTGALTIRSVNSDDAGIYKLQILKKGVMSTWEFNFSVYAPVRSPTFRRGISQKSSQCAVECYVKNGSEMSLSWYKGNELLNETSGPDNKTDPTVTLMTEQEDNGTYSCLASNPVSNITIQLNISEVCVQALDIATGSTFLQVLGGLCIILLVGLLVMALYCIQKRISVIKFEADHSVEEINYVDINIPGNALKPNVQIEFTRETETEKLVQCSDDMVVYSDVKTL